MPLPASIDFHPLASQIDGELLADHASRIAYATDASVYRSIPVAACIPKSYADITAALAFAREQNLPLIPRTAGTSLAGQVVGSGLVLDVSKHLNQILELNVAEKWVRVQPGVVRDELNQFLKPHGLMFAPETSTSNRCMIGGMVGNNSCGAHSMVYGSTRDHVLKIDAILSDGSTATFEALDSDQLSAKSKLPSLEGKIYRDLLALLAEPGAAEDISSHFPDPRIHRRNTGYAIDLLLDDSGKPKSPLNLATLLCGSEGTLAISTEITLALVPLPPSESAVVAVHLDSIPQAATATLLARKFSPVAVELIDHVILKCARTNAEQRANASFVDGSPGALLVVEFAFADSLQLDQTLAAFIDCLKSNSLGTSFPILRNEAVNRVWSLRNAGLGVLGNVPGDPKPLAGIEDTAVLPEDLENYVRDFLAIMEKHQAESVAYAHIGDGEIHFRPILDLKLGTDRKRYRAIAQDVATLVKRYRGSLSGEHGDGRARAEFIAQMIGPENYRRCQRIKAIFDPHNLLNPGKIVDAPPIDTELRYESDQRTRSFDTAFDFSETEGILRMAEKCNGTGACRKSERIGGVMCPSYMATRDETATTRARANVLREFLTRSSRTNPFDHEEIDAVMDLCLSCKACKSECPSNVDIARIKAEWQHQSHKTRGIPFRSQVFANIAYLQSLAAPFAPVFNFLSQCRPASFLLKKALGIHPKRSLPKLSNTSLDSWARKNLHRLNPPKNRTKKSVLLFCDEYTNYLDTQIGIAAIELLTALDYHVTIPDHTESGRAHFSKGLLDQAKRIANQNTRQLATIVSGQTPLLGIEPSTLLCFRDEYPDIVDSELKQSANDIAENAFLVEEFLFGELQAGNIESKTFTDAPQTIALHAHCYQKALGDPQQTLALLNLPKNFHASLINAGCCGMAGAFGYETEHFEVSNAIANLALVSAIVSAERETLIAANGTSCRHQILDTTNSPSKHPLEILRDALRSCPH